MFIQSKDATAFTIAGGTEGALFPSSPKGDQTVAMVTMDGVYPEHGYSYNDICTETICMVEGTFDIEYDEKNYTLNAGDILYILPEHKYKIAGKGTAYVFISPEWDSNQNHILES